MLATNYLKTASRARAVESGQGLEAARRRPPGVVDQLRAAPCRSATRRGGDRRARARAADRATLLRAGVQSGRRVPPQEDPARALEAYDLALTLKPDSFRRCARRPRSPSKQGELERVALVLDAGEEDRAGRSGDPAGIRPRLPQDGSAGGCRARADRRPPRLKPGEPAYQYTLAAAKVGKRQYEAAQACSSRWSRSSPSDAQLQYALGSVFYHRRGVWTRQRRGCGRACGCSRSSWRPTTTSRWSPGTRAATPRRSRCLSDCFSAIPITPRPARRWAGC